eukprot:5675783-Pyramimonas_sp.AAC.1
MGTGSCNKLRYLGLSHVTCCFGFAWWLTELGAIKTFARRSPLGARDTKGAAQLASKISA